MSTVVPTVDSGSGAPVTGGPTGSSPSPPCGSPSPPGTARPAARSSARRWAWYAFLAVSVAAAVVIVVGVVTTNASLLTTAAHSATTASPLWLVITGAAMALSFFASAVGIVGAAQGRVPVGRTTAAEFAGTFCNRLTPAGVGRTALRVRYLVCAGLTVERAASAVALSSIVGAAAYFAGMAAAGMDMRGIAATIVVSPGRMAIFLASVGLLAATLAVVVSSHRWKRSRHRHALAGHWATLRRELRDLAHDRWALAALFVGPLISSAGYVAAFWAALHSVGIPISLGTAAVVYVTSTAVATAVPVPGGVGAAELTLTAGLTTAGVSPGTALSGVLIFRLASLWLPSLVGAGTLIWLRRAGALSLDGAPHPPPQWIVNLRRRMQTVGIPRRVLVAGAALATATVVTTTTLAPEPLNAAQPPAVSGGNR